MGYALKVPSRELPKILPVPKALASCKQNSGAYEPWFWEVEYLSQRYLELMSLADLRERHGQILKNLSRLALPDRCQIPSQFFQSAWYWYRKEHQTRVEFSLRGIAPAGDPNPLIDAVDTNGMFSRNEVGEPTVLFRYTEKRFAEATRDFGVVRVAPAMSYRDIEGDLARADDEMVKTIFLHGKHTKLTDAKGNQIKATGDVRIEHGGPEYFVACFSSAWDARMFDDFPGTTHCVVVRDIDVFASRLEAAGRRHFEGWYFHHNPTWYFDPRESTLDSHVSHATGKDFKFAYQEEYRFLWANHGGKPVQGAQLLHLGPLTEIADVVERPPNCSS